MSFLKSKPTNNNNQHHGHNKQHFSNTENVHVDRNIIEDWIINFKKWFHHNPNFARNLIIIATVIIVISVISLILYTSLTKKQNNDFFKSYQQYTEHLKIKEETTKNEKLTALLKNTNKQCNVFWKTIHSYNSCLLEAIIYIAINKKEDALNPLDKYSSYHSSTAIAPLFLFHVAQGYENILNLDKAYEIYTLIDKILEPIKKNDIALYNKARVLYLQGKTDLALKQFKKLITEFPTTTYQEKAYQYISLIHVLKSPENTNK